MLLARCLGTALLLLLAPTTGCVAAVAASAAAAASEPDGDIGAACPSSSPAGCDSPESDRKATCDDEKACGVREEGESCGVYTPSCAGGLRCVPRPGERTPLQALLRGKGICLAPQPKRGGSKNQTEMEPVAGDGRRENYQTDHPTQEPLLLQIQDPLPDVVVDKSQLQQDPLNHGIKQEFDMGPCRMHLAAILQELKAPLYMNGEDIFIPNCDTKGFYRRKQCRTSKGQKRGRCWCVDKRGHRLEGLEESPLCLLANND
ncbi:insulin-like growth factor-binding protein 6 [Protobothrops mucrosquamatus]|uniref:insulin-like growth factor-binding protein 6 n=1 Tax=Protobothrops mucrosquamatus TaxID=103944 RepID=UPI0007759809|nr:insulin-like growth factor-binding protein 6 [Protobothrops mucrosquamatus]